MSDLQFRSLTLSAAIIASACASAPIRPEGEPPQARADRLMLDGCYDCLLGARAVYEDLATGSARPLILLRLFETNILLAIREKELAIPAVARLDAHLEGAPPLVAYRLDTCWFPQRDPLERIREQVPRFVETDLTVGQMELPVVPYNGPAKARPFFEALYRRFPNSPTVTVLTGNLYESAGDCATALRYYRETTALRPRQERALLGQTVCLSALNQSDSAIETASRLIAVGGSTDGQAFYWRAWNRYRLGNLPGARADVDSAKALEQTEEVLTLAGMIEHDQDQLNLAEADLDSALVQNDQNCIALRFLGQVSYKRQQWPDAASRLADATKCYSGSAADAERQLKTARDQTDWEPEFKAMRVNALETRVKEQRAQESRAALDAAANFLRCGDLQKAQSYVNLAARDPERAAAVRGLQELIGKMSKGPR